MEWNEWTITVTAFRKLDVANSSVSSPTGIPVFITKRPSSLQCLYSQSVRSRSWHGSAALSAWPTRGKVLSWEYRSPRKRNSRPPASVILCWVELRMYYLFIMRQVMCSVVYNSRRKSWFVYIGKNPRFTAFLGSNLHTLLAIVTENELGLAFPP